MSGIVELYDARRDVYYAKPLLRGWSHLFAFVVCLVLGTALVMAVRGTWMIMIAAVYAASVAGLFGVSALYHRGRWGRRAAQRLQRLDQVMIILLIAGTATPPIALCVATPYSYLALVLLWAAACVAAVARLIRLGVREWLAGAIFLGLGWTAGMALPAVWFRAGVIPAVLLLLGGLLYTIGAVFYHRRWPDPRPAVFGYHEVFHLFVCAGAACQYVAIGAFLL